MNAGADNWVRKIWAGQPEETFGMVQAGQERENRMARN
jgi:hypothetical protein